MKTKSFYGFIIVQKARFLKLKMVYQCYGTNREETRVLTLMILLVSGLVLHHAVKC